MRKVVFMLYKVMSSNTLLSSASSKLTLVCFICLLSACGGAGDGSSTSTAISPDTAPNQSANPDPSSSSDAPPVDDPSEQSIDDPAPSAEEIVDTEVLRTPAPAEFGVGSAVAPIESSMTAWMLNDVVKTSSLNIDKTDLPNVWMPFVLGEPRVDYAASVVVDENGWPMSMQLDNGIQADILSISLFNNSIANAYEAGTYTLTYSGSGEFDVSNVSVISESKGEMTLQYDGTGPITVEISATDLNNSGDYLREIKLLRPEAQANETFSQTYLDHLAQFSVVRPVHMMSSQLLYGMKDELGGYSHSQGANAWENRVKPDNASWGSAKGAPYEVIVQLANDSQSDLWLNVPIAADDNYVRKLAELILVELDTDRVIYLELGNALWNLTYPYAIGRDYAFAQAQLRWPNVLGSRPEYLSGKASEELMVASWYAARTQEVAAIFKEVWSSHASRIAVVMTGNVGTEATTVDLNRDILEAAIYVNEENADIPALNIDTFAVSMTIVDPWQQGEYVAEGGFDRTSATTYINEAINYVDGTDRFAATAAMPGMRYLVRKNADLAAEYNLPLVAYEGGHNFNGSTFTEEQVENSQEMYDLYNALFEMWQEESGALIMSANYIVDNSIEDACAKPLSAKAQLAGVKKTQQQSDISAPVFRAIKEVATTAG
ncbi:hypothetical protein [Alteromonas sp. ASW11-130]|uniref:hypothetical protein n=1 Tax=Alteromonas sp. ASW11-130 TaxID=3015775 RepID=UPI0022429384|nr:hypothetical protein [Alteromonas sp. ASW11-130]MCW8093133.1 hypothetical protein [Alteromonas sp. ASW11-130]